MNSLISRSHEESAITHEEYRLQTRPSAILREQQRSSGTLCAEAAVRTSHRLGKTTFGCPVAGNRPKTARRAAQDRPPRRRWRRRKLVPTPFQTPLPTHSYCATAVARPSDTTAGPDRAQPHLLCLPTRPARAALWGRTIIWHRQTPDRPRRPSLLFRTLPRACNPSLIYSNSKYHVSHVSITRIRHVPNRTTVQLYVYTVYSSTDRLGKKKGC